MINDNIKLTGELSIVLKDASGTVKEERHVKNLVVTTGKNYIASRMLGTTKPVMSYMAIGSGINPASLTDIALQTELTRVTSPNFTSALGSSPNIVSYMATFGPGIGTGPVTEAGILNAAMMGDLLARTVFAVVNKAEGDTLAIAWNITVA